MITMTVSHETYVALMAAFRECEERDAGTAAVDRWKIARKKIQAAALTAIVRELEYANPPEPGALVRPQI
jgi:hypothetical protein